LRSKCACERHSSRWRADFDRARIVPFLEAMRNPFRLFAWRLPGSLSISPFLKSSTFSNSDERKTQGKSPAKLQERRSILSEENNGFIEEEFTGFHGLGVSI